MLSLLGRGSVERAGLDRHMPVARVIVAGYAALRRLVADHRTFTPGDHTRVIEGLAALDAPAAKPDTV